MKKKVYKKLINNKPFVILVISGLVILFLGCVIFDTVNQTLARTSIIEVTPSQLASAMREDHFWYTYRFNTVTFYGEVMGTTPYKGLVAAQIKTSDSYGLTCIPTLQRDLKIGQTYHFAAEANQAERLPSGVLLTECVTLN